MSFGSTSFIVIVSLVLNVAFVSLSIALVNCPASTVILGASFVPKIVIVTVLSAVAVPSFTLIV